MAQFCYLNTQADETQAQEATATTSSMRKEEGGRNNQENKILNTNTSQLLFTKSSAALLFGGTTSAPIHSLLSQAPLCCLCLSAFAAAMTMARLLFLSLWPTAQVGDGTPGDMRGTNSSSGRYKAPPFALP